MNVIVLDVTTKHNENICEKSHYIIAASVLSIVKINRVAYKVNKCNIDYTHSSRNTVFMNVRKHPRLPVYFCCCCFMHEFIYPMGYSLFIALIVQFSSELLTILIIFVFAAIQSVLCVRMHRFIV